MTGVAESGGVISPNLAPNLKLRWTTTLCGPIASSPTIFNDVIYVGDWSGMESALAAADGSTLAQANLGTTTAPQCDPSMIGITSAAAVQNGIVYLAGGDDAFYALDAQTLDVIWRRSLGDNSSGGGYYGWCSPTVTHTSVLQGVSSNCDDPFIPGRVVSLDLFDGSTIQDAFMVEPEWPHDASGAGVWTSPAVDMAYQNVFVTTASALSMEDGRSYSIVRLDLDSMEIEESWKITDANQDDDADWGTSPTLFTDPEGRQLVGAGQKDGHYYAFLRRHLSAGPVWTTQLAKGGACPLCADGVLSTAAFDGKMLYVGAGRTPEEDALGSVSALDPATGNVVWRQKFDAPIIAPISYTNGVVFTTTGNHAIALDAATGERLWQFETGAMCVGGVSITDRGIFFGDLAGNLYHFAVEMPTRIHAVRAR
jgi:polyvinyl alcohol dehydrogenase (cytochrome)